MALTITSAEKDLVARSIFNQEYSATSSAEQDQIDKASIQSLNRIGQYAQAFTGTGHTVGTGDNIPAQWLHWWQSETELLVARAYRPSKIGEIIDARNDAIETAFTSYTDTAPDATNVGAASITPNGIRKYVLATCVRMNPRLFLDVQTVDAEMQEAFDRIWNARTWSFRTKPVTVRFSSIPFTSATWTNSSLTLAATGAFAGYTAATGESVRITDGTNAVKGDYVIASNTDDTLVLESSLSATGGDLSGGDIDGTVMVARVFGLSSGETMKRLAGRKLRTSTGYDCVWATSDGMANMVSDSMMIPNETRAFRYDFAPDGTLRWRFFPMPEEGDAVECRGLAELAGPTVLGAADSSTLLEQLPRRFRILARDLTLALVKEKHRPNSVSESAESILTRRITELMEDDDKGPVDDSVGTLDVYGDSRSYTDCGGGGL